MALINDEWTIIDDEHDASPLSILGHDGRVVCDLATPTTPETWDAARLIAAAPKMRDALLNMLGAFDNPLRRMKMPGDFEEECIASARAALAATKRA